MAFIKKITDPGTSDTELVKSYQANGDLQVLGVLYQRYMELVYGVCLKYLSAHEPSRDAVMEIFEELVKKLGKHEVENFRGWLYTVAKNHCLMKLRSQKKQTIVSISPELMQSEDELHLNGVWQKESELRKMEHCLQKLAEEQKQAVSLFYLEQQSYNQIVEQTGLDWKKVRSLIQNGRRNLKICMDSLED